MPSSFTAYAVATEADKAQKVADSRRSSANSVSSNEATPNASRRSSIKRVLDSFRPAEQQTRPTGIYTPIIQNGPLFSRKKPAEWNKLSRYEKNAAIATLMC